jgi:transcriptional regulator GlxA family with amidase domain
MKRGNKDMGSNRLILLVGFEGAAAIDITGPYEVFAMAAHLKGDRPEPPYRVIVVADKAGPFRTASGLSLVADASWRDFKGCPDTLLVAGGPELDHLVGNVELLQWLDTMANHTRRMGSVCTGAFALAQAGLLDNHRATTHWREVERLKQAHPKVTVEPDAIYVKDGNVYTSAGVTAGMDLALALVEEDLGHETALAVARMLVLFLKRPGGQSQFSTMLQAQKTEGKRLAPLLGWLTQNYRRSLTVEEMAAQAAMSQRTFARVFLAETGVTPAHFLEKIRMEHAVRLLETSNIAVEAAARECGFAGCEQLRRAFLRNLGVSPREYQKRFRASFHPETPDEKLLVSDSKSGDFFSW